MIQLKTMLIPFCLAGFLSAAFAGQPDSSHLWYIHFGNANTRPTYDDFHQITDVQKMATGKEIKIGIIDTYFGYRHNEPLFAGGRNFTGDTSSFEEIAEHGFWMATTLREIAPGAEIYALNARHKDRVIETQAIASAIDWAIENGLNILTYSAQPFREQNRPDIDRALRKAIANNITVIFIHYDLPENILPFAFLPESVFPYSRKPDVNLFHYDYNLLLLDKYRQYLAAGKKQPESLRDHPYLSFSSMAPVLAGIVAMMKEIDPALTPADCKRILIETSREIQYDGFMVKRAVDALQALKQVQVAP